MLDAIIFARRIRAVGIVIENVQEFRKTDNGLCFIFFTDFAKMAGFETRVYPVSAKTAHLFLARSRVIAHLWNPGCYDSSSNQECFV